MITVTQKVFFAYGSHGRRRIVDKPPPTLTVPEGRVPRLAKLTALALQFEELIRSRQLDLPAAATFRAQQRKGQDLARGREAVCPVDWGQCGYWGRRCGPSGRMLLDGGNRARNFGRPAI